MNTKLNNKQENIILLANKIMEKHKLKNDKPTIFLAMTEFARIILESNEKKTFR
jgi:hypothetical protein